MDAAVFFNQRSSLAGQHLPDRFAAYAFGDQRIERCNGGIQPLEQDDIGERLPLRVGPIWRNL